MHLLRGCFALTLVVVLASVAHVADCINVTAYDATCQQNCCCKVCSSPSNEAFPYGLTEVNIQTNPSFPKVRGSTCHFPVWSDRQYNDTSGNPVTPPDTLWWTSFAVFGDSNTYTAPMTCDCCQFSGIDTSCSETRPAARRPQHFYLMGGYAIEYKAATLVFEDGVELSSTDIAELRNDTHCGYGRPAGVMRRSNLTILTGSKGVEASEARWTINRLPSNGCYRVCYFHSTLTTPTWYTIGFLTVHNQPQADVTYKVNPRHITLGGNTVTITYFGRNLLSVFDDAASMVFGGTCGVGVPTTSTILTTNGILNVQGEWCKPPVEQPISTIRPLRRLAIAYSTCKSANRIYQNEVEWEVKLPTTAFDQNIVMCYRLGAFWYTLAPLRIYAQQSAAVALNSLYTATNGPSWIGQRGWGGSNACLFHGIRCKAGKVTAIHLGRNNLVGTIPNTFFLADFFDSLEHIALDMNSLSGTLPITIGALRQLKFLDLGYNQMTGTLPITLRHTSLDVLYVSNNQFDGSVPETLAELQLLWDKATNVTDGEAIPPPPSCPYDVLECSQRGSTDAGVFPCGYDSISELECTVRGCCFNAQAPLVFGGTACFTKRSAFVNTHPTCTSESCTVVAYVPP